MYPFQTVAAIASKTISFPYVICNGPLIGRDTGSLKIYLYFVGKPRDEHANAIAAEFLKRSARYLACEMREIVPARFDLFARHGHARKVFLDPGGQVLDSAAFAALVSQAERNAQDLVFLVGGHDGLPPEWKPRADLLLSLSRLTFPHELARAIISEQIYRAIATVRGHPYPR
jgi:23S rRNA (pseudouridine1915-N3)-methyltransferase